METPTLVLTATGLLALIAGPRLTQMRSITSRASKRLRGGRELAPLLGASIPVDFVGQVGNLLPIVKSACGRRLPIFPSRNYLLRGFTFSSIASAAAYVLGKPERVSTTPPT